MIAYDIAPQMLATVDGAARERGLANIHTQQGAAETLPFADHSFDWVISRMSAHHWHDVPRALAEVRRVLKLGGKVLFIDIAGIDHPLLDTHIQAIELLRDGSHIRDYRADEWVALFTAAGFEASIRERWRIDIEFNSWVARMRTPEPRVVAIRSMWAGAPDEVRQYFDVQEDGSFKGLRTLSIRADIEIVPNRTKNTESQPDYRVVTNGVEIGAAWQRTSRDSGASYVSLSLAAPEFGPRRLYANLGRAAGQDDDNVFAVIWNPAD